MDTKKIRKILGWCAVINYGLLILVAILLLCVHNWLYEFNQLFFAVSEEAYNKILLIALVLWEVLIWVLNIAPYIALRIVDRN